MTAPLETVRRLGDRLLVGVCLLFVAAAAVVAAVAFWPDDGAPREVQLGDADDGSVVRVAKGGTVLVALASNPSTGFSWYVRDTGGGGLDLVDGPRYVPPGSTSPVVGAPGTEIFIFRASAAGTIQGVLEYRRSFEPDSPPVRTFRFTVKVE